MAARDTEREEILTELLLQFESRLRDGGQAEPLDTSKIADDDLLCTEWESDRRCLELLNRVRGDWSPADEELATPSPAQSELSTNGLHRGKRLGRFKILGELGHGGLGIVYLAYDPQLHRQVALKVPRPESLISSDLRRRFLREAEAAARLNHPQLVAVYDSGEDGAICYIASEFCPGPTLATWLARRQEPVPIGLAARLVKDLAQAVGHAHSRGVLHRDIKPSNVLLSRGGSDCSNDNSSAATNRPDQDASNVAVALSPEQVWPKLTDFGMAKLLERDGEETRSGALVGTPAYMSPEQARGQVRELDARTDVYALGAILYEVLTGRRVFESDSDIDALRQVLFEEPTRPRQIRPDIPRDLEAICLKCLAKSSDARYATAQQLVDDLDRFLVGKPTEARPLSATARSWKWAKRRPALAALVAGAGIAAATLLAVTLAYNTRLTQEVARAEREAQASRRLLYTADVRVAHENLKGNNVVQALEVLNRHLPKSGVEDLREFAWYYLRGQCEPDTLNLVGHTSDIFSIAYSPDGALLATASKDGTARIWNAATGKPLRVLRGHTTEVTSVAFSPDSKTLATGSEDHSVRLWNVADGKAVAKLEGHIDHVLSVAYSNDGKYLASGGRDGAVRVWDAGTGQPIITLGGESAVIRSVAFLPRSDVVLAGDESGRVRFWRTSSWQQLEDKISGKRFFTVAVDPRGKIIAAAGIERIIGVWRWQGHKSKRLQELNTSHTEWIQSLAFSGTDTFASGGKDGVIHLWRLEDPTPLRTLLGHQARVWSLAWSPDGHHLASAGADGARVWTIGADDTTDRFPPKSHAIYDVELTSDGEVVYSSDGAGDLRAWKNAVTLSKARVHSGPAKAIALSYDDSLLATRGIDRLTKVWRREPLEELFSMPTQGEYSVIAWAPLSRELAFAIDDQTVALLNADTWEIERRFAHQSTVRMAAFTPDGTRLITTSHALQIWNAASGALEYTLPESHADVVTDGRIVAALPGANVSVLDLATRRKIATLVTGGSRADCLALHTNTLAVGQFNPACVTLWDTRTHQLLMSLHCDAGELINLEFSPDGTQLYAAGIDLEARGRIWVWAIHSD